MTANPPINNNPTRIFRILDSAMDFDGIFIESYVGAPIL